MKTIVHKGWIIEKFIHPKLKGKYSLFDINGIEMCRTNTIEEAKAVIDKNLTR